LALGRLFRNDRTTPIIVVVMAEDHARMGAAGDGMKPKSDATAEIAKEWNLIKSDAPGTPTWMWAVVSPDTNQYDVRSPAVASRGHRIQKFMFLAWCAPPSSSLHVCGPPLDSPVHEVFNPAIWCCFGLWSGKHDAFRKKFYDSSLASFTETAYAPGICFEP